MTNFPAMAHIREERLPLDSLATISNDHRHDARRGPPGRLPSAQQGDTVQT